MNLNTGAGGGMLKNADRRGAERCARRFIIKLRKTLARHNSGEKKTTADIGL
jgi:hypothetical protein